MRMRPGSMIHNCPSIACVSVGGVIAESASNFWGGNAVVGLVLWFHGSRWAQLMRYTVAMAHAGEPTAPGRLSGGAVRKNELRLFFRSQSASSDSRQISPRLTPVLNSA